MKIFLSLFNKNLYLFPVYLFLINSVITHSQDRIKTDSLLNILKTLKQDTSMANIYNELFLHYVDNDTSKALYYSRLLHEFSEKINFRKGIVNYLHGMGVFYYYQGDYSLSIDYLRKSLKLREELGDKKGISSAYNNIGIDYSSQADYPKAIEYYQKSLKIDEELGNKRGVSQCYVNIGIVQSLQGNYTSAIDYYQKSLNIIDDLLAQKKNKSDIQELITGKSTCYTNLGLVYYLLHNFPKALEYYQNSLNIAEKYGDKKAISQGLNNIGMVYDDLGSAAKAIEYYQKSLDIIKELGDKGSMPVVLSNIASLKIKLKNYKEAIEYSEKSRKISKEIGSLDDERLAYVNLSNAYKGMKNFSKALEYYEISRRLTDSIFNLEKHKQLSEMEAKYQSEKKQKEIEILNKDKRLQAYEVRSQKLQKYALTGGLLLMVILSVVILKSYRDKKKANILLAEQKKKIEEKNEELNQQNEEIRTQRDEIEAQRNEISSQHDLVTQQKEHIETIYSELTDSIHYAERIQKAVLPTEEYVWNILSALSSQEPVKAIQNSLLERNERDDNFFILFKPKDIVSGDFYWIAKRNKWLLIAVADCTGHGVPGGFMSMLGISFLNEIVARDEINSASLVLDELREYVIKSLQQKGISGEQKDGMDMAFAAIDLNPQTTQTSQVLLSSAPGETSEVCVTFNAQFAGANNPVYIVETGESPVSTVREIRPDKMPIGIHENMQPFTNHIIELQKGDTIYMMSDGYEDQFGGPKGKRFQLKCLKEMLVVNGHLSMEKQKEILDKTIEDWKNEFSEKYEQTDDITVLGIKI
ncbi:MAG: tetratricopeptide repeat protein [Bacteroidia bacterium]|nr:tetratricopeptide repeat protein [Bacteroidia bacterium]